MNSKFIEEKKARLKLTKRQKEIIVGLLLGDGHLETQNYGKTFRLKVEQSIAHKAYVDWLFSELQEFVLTGPKARKKLSYGKIRWNYGFQTLSLGSLRFFAHQFYGEPAGEKRIPRIIRKLLSSLVLAVWFMDDGQIKSKKHRTLLINTQSFSRKDLQVLQAALRERFGIETSLQKARGQWRLYLQSSTIKTFLKLINPYLIPSMRYKIGMNTHA